MCRWYTCGSRLGSAILLVVFKQHLCQSPWTVRPSGDLSEVPAAAKRSIPAQVPGCIHLDLIRARIIAHPRQGLAELDQFWVGKTDWRYECRFEPDSSLFDHGRIDLVCEGLDTIATIELNGNVIGAAANMFHPHRFRLSDLKRGQNHLAIAFRSPLQHIREEEARIGARPVNGDWDPYIFIRKAAANFGWDFAPKVPTSGIWKPIRLEAWSGVRLAGVRPLVRRATGSAWHVDIRADLEWCGDASARDMNFIAVFDRDGDAERRGRVTIQPQQSSVRLVLLVDNPRLWWPRGHGDAHLYPLDVFVSDFGQPEEQPPTDSLLARIGFREVRLNTDADEHGSKFQFEVNGKPIFCKGANWVPDALFPTEVACERYRERVQQAADANMNMLRVWGGGYYEDEEFYRACDERGILIWQDFMFACAMYPEESPFPYLIESEARHQVTRLSSHPSVALWCGGNECIWAYESWGHAPGETPWKTRLGGKTWGRLYYLDLLPRLVAELDPTRPYWANSPWSGSDLIPTNGTNHGDRHTWDARLDGYRTITPRFCSELGQQSPSCWETLENSIGASQMTMGSAALTHRQRATGGTAKLIDELLAAQGPPPTALRDWFAESHRLQQLALEHGIEWLLSQRPRCMGILLWQFNEMWPGLSWSLIDADGRPKPAWHTVRQLFAS